MFLTPIRLNTPTPNTTPTSKPTPSPKASKQYWLYRTPAAPWLADKSQSPLQQLRAHPLRGLILVGAIGVPAAGLLAFTCSAVGKQQRHMERVRESEESAPA